MENTTENITATNVDTTCSSSTETVTNVDTTCSSSTSDIPTPNSLPPTGLASHPLRNKGKRWSTDEEARLLELYVKEEKGVDEIAELFERTPFAIVCRLVFLNVISDASNIRGYVKLPEVERVIDLKGTNEEIVLPAFVKREKVAKPPKAPRVPKEKVPRAPKVKCSAAEKVRAVSKKKPTYKVMITKALTALYRSGVCDEDERWGSLVYIKKYLEANYNVTNNNQIIKTIRELLRTEVLIQPPGNYPHSFRGLYSLKAMNLPFPKPRGVKIECYSDSENDSVDSSAKGCGLFAGDTSFVETKQSDTFFQSEAQVFSCDSSEDF